ncbi:tetratricopeptide repeat protein [Candidatus Venteria ishoeyi]|nr:tetratricopeptide repeat protein [Candidatus Venteria ishoeyi]MDM8545286.1 tetratricopeptide repeat protein [Candidatus Venteria ishoeyi]
MSQTQTTATTPEFKKYLSSPLFHLLLIAIAIVAVYFHTLDVPFYMDDFSSIRENPVIYLGQGLETIWHYAPPRVVGYLSFALNYQVHQFGLTGYHLVNIFIHLLVSLAIYGFLHRLLRTPRLQDKLPPLALIGIPVFAALLFALHPLHTQAVTYIVQRLAAMAALFYILTMLAFVQARLANSITQRSLWIGFCLLFAALAFFTKQNTATLPFALLLIEGIFFRETLKRFLIEIALVLLALLSLWLILAYGFEYRPFSLEAMQAMSRETTSISRMEYLATQTTVIWHYVKLFFIPVGLHIDYDLIALTGFANAKVVAALLGHVAMIGMALWLMRKMPLLAFAILFYYLAHSVESSLIPIRDVVFEHRTYLPDLGLSLLVAIVLLLWLPRLLDRQAITILGLVLLVLFAMQTWQRNETWRNPVALWHDNVKHAPNKARGWSILGKHYLQTQQPKLAMQSLQRSMQIQQASGKGIINTVDVINLIVALKHLERYDEALKLTKDVMAYPMPPLLRSKFLINRANIYFARKDYPRAENNLRHAIKTYPNSITARANLASLMGSTGRFDEAEKLYNEVLVLDPDNAVTQDNLKKVRALRQQSQ